MAIIGTGAGGFSLGGVERRVAERLERWQREGFAARLWQKDPSLWASEPFPPELADRLGWLDLPAASQAILPELERLADEVAAEGFEDAVVLGMGGSSLAPEVFAETFGRRPGRLRVRVLDSTHPDAVRGLAAEIDPAKTLFLVSSKSGGTTETLSFFHYFRGVVRGLRTGGAGDPGDPGDDAAGRHFVVVTDPGSALDALGREIGARCVVHTPPDVGGRYSALTAFGLLPAALQGMDVAGLLARARQMAAACGPGVPAAESPGLVLGAALGELALAGCDKLTLVTSRSISAFPLWLEQLIAESTGKNGRGIVPVAGEPLGPPAVYGEDRAFAALLVHHDGGHEGDADEGADEGNDAELGRRLAELEAAGHPVIRLALADTLDLGREIFRWEVAVAAAGAVLGINPFDQPDVQLAKELAKKAMAERSAGSSTAGPRGVGAADPEALRRAAEDGLAGLAPGHYLGLHAYLAPRAPTSAAEGVLRRLQGSLRDATRRAVTLGWGPRFLHSTGQLHKGGPPGGRFLQIVDRPREDLPVPETDYTFGELIRAQAAGDRSALERRGRQVVTVDLGEDAAAGLERLEGAFAPREEASPG